MNSGYHAVYLAEELRCFSFSKSINVSREEELNFIKFWRMEIKFLGAKLKTFQIEMELLSELFSFQVNFRSIQSMGGGGGVSANTRILAICCPRF